MEFTAGHPCYYKEGGKILSINEITPGRVTDQDYTYWRKRFKSDLEMLTYFQNQLEIDIQLYKKLVEKGINALSEYDIKCASGGNAELALHTALSLKHNHVCYHKGYVEYMTNKVNALQQMSLF